jgi:hypothetical protein
MKTYIQMRKQQKIGQTPPSGNNDFFNRPVSTNFDRRRAEAIDDANSISPGISVPRGQIENGQAPFFPGEIVVPGPETFNTSQLQKFIDDGVAEQLRKINNQTKAASAIFTTLDPANDIVTTENELITGGVWSDNIASLITYASSSSETLAQRRYYLDVYAENPANEGAAVQFSVAYGHALGSGSDSQGQLNDSPARAVYSQYRSLLLAPNDTRFTTPSGSTNSIYVINFKRARLKERLDPGNFELPIAAITSRAVNATGSVVVNTSNIITLIDDSSLATATVGESGKVYNIVSGSINNGVFNPTAPVYYGLAYPDHGILVLDGVKLDQVLAFKTQVSSSIECNNHFALYHAISGSCTVTNPSTGDKYGFLARNSEKITSKHFFVRIKNGQYNFSNNPTFVTGSVGQIYEPSFRNGDPKTYVTTVGLYNNNQELLAIAKLSKPLLKSFNREALIRVKLDF